MASSRPDALVPFTIPSGTMLGKFEVLRRIASGGMADIYLARLHGHAGFEKLVVIKRILPTAASNPRLIQMFLDEARLVATLHHPNIADVYEVGEHQGAPFFAMEYVHGQDVRSIRKAASERRQGVPLRVSLAIVQATASALDYAHDRSGPDGANLNLVHRDISPSNILVSYEGAIRLIDFGVARVTGQSNTTQSGTVRGKCPYMSPEQCRGLPLDRRSDLFSLGAVLYELTTGRRPFVGDSDFDIMDQIVNHDARRPTLMTDGYPPELERIVMKLLTRNPERRYQTAEDLLHDLEAFVEANHLWIPPKKLSRYMRTLFGDRLIAWEAATQGDTATFAEHVALALDPGNRGPGEVTPPTPVPVVMRLAQEIAAVELDQDASLAQVYRSDDPKDPLGSILESSVVQPNKDTITVRTDESAAPFDESIAQPSGGDTVTVRTGEPDMSEAPARASDPDWPESQASTITHSLERPDTAVDDTTTLRADRNDVVKIVELNHPKPAADDRTAPGWPAPVAGAAPRTSPAVVTISPRKASRAALRQKSLPTRQMRGSESAGHGLLLVALCIALVAAAFVVWLVARRF